jgi:hypothetical protein
MRIFMGRVRILIRLRAKGSGLDCGKLQGFPGNSPA